MTTGSCHRSECSSYRYSPKWYHPQYCTQLRSAHNTLGMRALVNSDSKSIQQPIQSGAITPCLVSFYRYEYVCFFSGVTTVFDRILRFAFPSETSRALRVMKNTRRTFLFLTNCELGADQQPLRTLRCHMSDYSEARVKQTNTHEC